MARLALAFPLSFFTSVPPCCGENVHFHRLLNKRGLPVVDVPVGGNQGLTHWIAEVTVITNA
jgi:hypothetical protein